MTNSSYQQSKILLCDDSISNLLLLEKLLESEGFEQVTTVSDPEQALENLVTEEYDLLLLDIEMPKMNGLEVLKHIRNRQLVNELFPIIILTGRKDEFTRNKALEMGAIDFINKPFDQTEIVLRVGNTLKQYSALKLQQNLTQALNAEVKARTEQLELSQKLLIKRLATVGELKDIETANHVTRVGEMAKHLAMLSGIPTEIAAMIGLAAPLHDLGKIAIPDEILLKQGTLNQDQWQTMKTHAEIGAKLLHSPDSHLAQMASSIALSHHEKWDGSGYPNKLKGETIPIEGRITAICDVFDALMSRRPYKEKWTLKESINEINSLAGKQFDPRLVKLFLNNIDEFLAINQQYQD